MKSVEEQAVVNRQQPTIVSVCLNCKKGACTCSFRGKEERGKEERRFLFPFEENEEDSQEALRYFLKHIYRGEGDEIIFLHVVPTSYRRVYHDTMVVHLKPENELEWREKCADFVERALVPILKEKDAKHNRLEMVSYDPSERSIGEVIVRKSEEHDVCCVSCWRITSRECTNFSRRSANYVLHRTSKPVMLYKKEESKKETEDLE